jgi:flagellar motor component MotA
MLELYRQLNCTFTDSEKEECIPIISRMVELCDMARANGVLPLDNILYSTESNTFIRVGIELMLSVPQTPTETISEVFKIIILAHKCEGSKLLSQLIVAQGIISIATGDSSKALVERLSPMLGPEYLDKDDEYYRNQ